MKTVAFATIAAAGLAATAFGLTSPASAAPEGGSAQDTISSLEAQGYTVIVNKTGNAPLSQCTVGAVQVGKPRFRTDSGVPGAKGDYEKTVVGKTVVVYLSC